MLDTLNDAFDDLHVPVLRGATWTTDAPFRETVETIKVMRQRGLLAVEMEAAALYAYAKACDKPVICFAHVTNQMGQIEGDFEKGQASGATDALSILVKAARRILKIGYRYEPHKQKISNTMTKSTKERKRSR